MFCYTKNFIIVYESIYIERDIVMVKKVKKQGLKKQVLIELLEQYYLQGKSEFNNEDIQEITKKYKFKNAFDVTKIDNISILPQEYIANDVFIAHIGKGKHKFINGINKAYHYFEKMEDDEIEEWSYKPSLLNESNSSEANIVSLAYNQKVIKNFLYEEDRISEPLRYDPGRTKYTGEYFIGKDQVIATQVQMELDSHAEHNGIVDIFEAKNSKADNFSIYQIFLPFLHFTKLQAEGVAIKKIRCNFLLRQIKGDKQTIIKIYQYSFPKPKDMSSIELLQKKQYNLVKF